MQGLRAFRESSDNLKLESPNDTPKAFSNDGRLRSKSFTEAAHKTEAALRAQLMELRRELSSSQQEVEQTKLDLKQRQDLLRSAAGEARREVLTLRQQVEERDGELQAASQRICDLEHEIAELEAGKVVDGEDNAAVHRLEAALEDKEDELSRLRASERVHVASKEALNAQIGEVVEKLTILQAELTESQDAQKELQQKALQLKDRLRQETEANLELQQQLGALNRENEQLTSQAELLQNELNVVGSEGTEDRLSGAAHLLELTQQCEELRARLEESKATASQGAESVSGPSTPDAKGRQGPPWNAGLADSLASPQKRLLAELMEASSYLQQLSRRLDTERQSPSDLEAQAAGEEDKESASKAVKSFSAALNALQDNLGQQKLQALLGGQAPVQIHADSSRQQNKGNGKERMHNQPRFGPGLIGGLIVIPAIAAVLAFLPRKH